MGGITVMGIVLLIVSAIVFVISFLLPEEKGTDAGVNKELAQEEIKDLVQKEMEQIRGHVDEVVEESMTYAMEKTERSLERLSNEKIMAVNEYSDTVIQEIHKNHEEVVFLYDMLNSKHDSLKKTVSEASKAAKAMQDSVESFQNLKPAADSVDTPASGVSQEEKAALTEMPRMSTPAFRQIPLGSRKVKKEDLAVEEISEESKAPESTPDTVETPEVTADIQLGGDLARNSNERILELHNQGKSNVAIAKELGLGVGEVKLVIDLYKNM